MHFNLLSLATLSLCTLGSASNPKRGLISDVNGATYKEDSNALTSSRVKSVSWYYSFGHYPDSKFSKRYDFVMQQFGVDEKPAGKNKYVLSRPTIQAKSVLTRYTPQFQKHQDPRVRCCQDQAQASVHLSRASHPRHHARRGGQGLETVHHSAQEEVPQHADRITLAHVRITFEAPCTRQGS